MRRWRAVAIGVLTLTVIGTVVRVASTEWPTKDWLERGYFVTQILGLIVTASAAVLVYLQVLDIRQTLQRADFDSTSVRILRISELILDHPREYADLVRNRISTRSRALGEAILDIMDTELLRREAMPDLLGAQVPSLRGYFSDLLVEVPGLVSVLMQRANWYSADLASLAIQGRDVKDGN